jgi:putative endonuclease
MLGRSERRLPRRSRKAKAGFCEIDITYVYILRSIGISERYYVGVTRDLRSRLQKHNAGEVPHTSKYVPWEIKTYVAFSNETQAFAFERYLKSPSGRAFAKKRL